METIRALLSNGIIFPLKKIDAKKIKNNTIKIELVEKDNLTKLEKKGQLKKIFSELHKTNPFKAIEDPVEWQAQIREERELSDR